MGSHPRVRVVQIIHVWADGYEYHSLLLETHVSLFLKIAEKPALPL